MVNLWYGTSFMQNFRLLNIINSIWLIAAMYQECFRASKMGFSFKGQKHLHLHKVSVLKHRIFKLKSTTHTQQTGAGMKTKSFSWF